MTTATPIEVRKIAYRQSAKDGLVITFSVHPNDMPASLAAAPIGARFMAALVEIGDDEKPKGGGSHKPEHGPDDTRPSSPSTKAAGADKERRAWATLTPTVQAGIRCGEKRFQVFVAEKGYAPDDLGPEISGEDIARAGVLHYCGVESRAELSTNKHKAALWAQMDGEYLGWQRGM